MGPHPHPLLAGQPLAPKGKVVTAAEAVRLKIGRAHV